MTDKHTSRSQHRPQNGERGPVQTLPCSRGLFSAFGAAYLLRPFLYVLGPLGLASAWLGKLALLAGPHRPGAAGRCCHLPGSQVVGCCSGAAAAATRLPAGGWFAVGRLPSALI